MLITSIALTAVLVAAAVSGTAAMWRAWATWRDPVFDDAAWRAARRRCLWALLTAVAVVPIDLLTGAVPGVVELGSLLVVGAAYLMARRFRADVYLQRRVAWEEQMRVHLAMPDATKGE